MFFSMPDTTDWNALAKSAQDSIDHPGKAVSPLPKDKITPGENFVAVFRHGESEDNVMRIFSGWRDVHLTETGKEQAKLLRPLLQKLPVDVVITSDLIRSKETALIVFDGNSHVVFEEDWRIKERCYGDLQGKNKEELMELDSKDAIAWRRGYDSPPPNGESLKMVEERVIPFLEELSARIKREKINVALSVHGNSMRAIRRYFEHMTIEQMTTHENPLGTDYALYVIR